MNIETAHSVGSPIRRTIRQEVRRDFSQVDLAEAQRRANDLVPFLRERAPASEDARRLLPEIEQKLHESGLFRLHQPAMFGGMELDFIAIVDIPMALARGCPSTAWNVGNLGCHHWMLGFFDLETQHEVWDDNPDALIASSIALAAGKAQKVKGGFRVTGRWPFSSGVDNCDWNLLAISVIDDETGKAVDWRLCLVPNTDYEILDTWDAMGMCATGSKDIVAKDIFVPERRALPLLKCRGGYAHPGGAVHHGQVYGVPLVAGAAHPLAPAAIGAANAAFELFVESVSNREGTYTGARVADFQSVQVKVARARCLIDSAVLLIRQSAMDLGRMASEGVQPDLGTKLRLRAQAAMAVNQSREAVETLWSCYGAKGLYRSDPLQRHLRDVIAMNQHFSFNFDIAGSAYGMHTLGGTYSNPTM